MKNLKLKLTIYLEDSIINKINITVMYKTILKKKFGFADFREHQLEIVKAIIEKKQDVCAIMFTGFGKSLCYQFPPIFTKKIALVVSPLISLMQDQQDKMSELNITTTCFNSSVSDKQLVIKNIMNNKYSIVYTTPET